MCILVRKIAAGNKIQDTKHIEKEKKKKRKKKSKLDVHHFCLSKRENNLTVNFFVMESDPLLSVQNGEQHHVGRTSWPTSASLIVANMLGAGVLGLPNAVKGMGITASIIFMVVVTSMR